MKPTKQIIFNNIFSVFIKNFDAAEILIFLINLKQAENQSNFAKKKTSTGKLNQ